MSNGSITLSGDDIRKILRSVFRSCPTAQRLGTPSEHLLFLYRTHPSKQQGYPLWHMLQFLLSEVTFSVWCSALNVGLPLSETKLGHSHCVPSIRRGWQGNEKGHRAGQRQKLKYLTIPSKFGTQLTIRSTASTDVHLSKSPSGADLEANLSSGGPSRLSPYGHAESLLQGVPQFPCAWESGPMDTKYESTYIGKLDCSKQEKKKQLPGHRVLQTTEW